jgi:hypothetical protein
MAMADGNILARWQTSLETSACSPLEFYDRVQRSLSERELPDLRFSHITRNEKGWFSSRRVYLRIRYQRLYFDVSAFVAGTSLVVGWWLHLEQPGIADLLAEIPGFGFLIEKTARAATYYQADFIEFVQRAIHDSILRVVDELSEDDDLEYLPAEARVPVWEDIW